MTPPLGEIPHLQGRFLWQITHKPLFLYWFLIDMLGILLASLDLQKCAGHFRPFQVCPEKEVSLEGRSGSGTGQVIRWNNRKGGS